jgi:hypothetical protein
LAQNPHVLLPERRIEQRRFPCRIPARIALAAGETYCVIENISMGGLGLYTDAVIRLKIEQRVIITAPEIGSLISVVRWVAGNHAGVMFKASGNDFEHVRSLIVKMSEAAPES